MTMNREEFQKMVESDEKLLARFQENPIEVCSEYGIELTEEEYGIRIVKTVSQENYNNDIWDQWVIFSRRIYDNISKILKGK